MAVSAGHLSHSAALRSDGLIFACGYNGYGQLGDNTITSRRTYVQALGISNAIAVACGPVHVTALRADGLVFSTGRNTDGQLGDNTTTSQRTFVQALGISNAIAISAGNNSHVVALRSDGAVFTCGKNNHGQLGDGTTTGKSTFVQALGVSNVVAIACGYGQTVALRSDGLVFSTGYNNYGQLGINSITSTSTFIQAINP